MQLVPGSQWKTETEEKVLYKNHVIPNHFLWPGFGRVLALARLATSHAFCGAYIPNCAAKKDSYPGESNAKPVCFDISSGS